MPPVDDRQQGGVVIGAREHVELIDYLAVAWRRKWLIALGTLACVVVAALIVWFTPRTYRVDVAIDGGDLNERSAQRLVASINHAGFGPEVGLPAGSVPAARFQEPSIVHITVDTGAPKEAARALERAAAGIVRDLARMVDAQGEESRTELASLQNEVDRLEQGRVAKERRLDEVRQSVERLRKARAEAMQRAQDPHALLLAIRISDEVDRQENERRSLHAELARIPGEIDRLKAQTRVHAVRLESVRPPRLLAPVSPGAVVRPRVKPTLALAFGVGFVGSVLLASFLEYLREASARGRSRF